MDVKETLLLNEGGGEDAQLDLEAKLALNADKEMDE